MAISVFQNNQDLALFVERLLDTRNDVQVLRDRVLSYQSSVGSMTEEEAANVLLQIDVGSQGLRQCLFKIENLVQFIDINLSSTQKTALNQLADKMYGVEAADSLRNIYQGLKTLRSALTNARRPGLDRNITYAQMAADMSTLPSEIDTIEFVEKGTSPR